MIFINWPIRMYTIVTSLPYIHCPKIIRSSVDLGSRKLWLAWCEAICLCNHCLIKSYKLQGVIPTICRNASSQNLQHIFLKTSLDKLLSCLIRALSSKGLRWRVEKQHAQKWIFVNYPNSSLSLVLGKIKKVKCPVELSTACWRYFFTANVDMGKVLSEVWLNSWKYTTLDQCFYFAMVGWHHNTAMIWFKVNNVVTTNDMFQYPSH